MWCFSIHGGTLTTMRHTREMEQGGCRVAYARPCVQHLDHDAIYTHDGRSRASVQGQCGCSGHLRAGQERLAAAGHPDRGHLQNRESSPG